MANIESPVGLAQNNLLTLNQISSVYEVIEEIVENLDTVSLKEIYQGEDRDIDELIKILYEETSGVLFCKQGKIKNASFNYIDRLAETLEETLRKVSLNYFAISAMPHIDVNWHHLEWGNIIQLYRLISILAARDHSKSTWFSRVYPLWKMYRYEKPSTLKRVKREYQLSQKGMLITSSQTLGRELFQFIIDDINDNDLIKEKLHPTPAKGGILGVDKIMASNGASFRLRSYGSTTRGFHPGYIIIDDMLDDSALYSPTIRQQIIDYILAVIMNMILPDGQVIAVGTPFHSEDAYGALKKNPMFKSFEYPAIFPDGSLLWQNRYNLKSLLEKRKTQGPIIFSREILVVPVSDQSSIFPWDMLRKAFKGMETFTLVDNKFSFPKKFKKIATGCDFAISASIGADSSTFITIGEEENGTKWLINFWKGAGVHYSQQIAELKRINSNFNPDIFVVETNNMQEIFAQMLDEAGLPILRHNTNVEKWSLKEGLPGMIILFEREEVKFPRGDEKSKNASDLICTGLNAFTFNVEKQEITSVIHTSDDAMAFWQALRGLKYIETAGFSYSFI